MSSRTWIATALPDTEATLATDGRDIPLQNVLFVVPSLGGGGAEMNAVRLSHPLHELGAHCTYASLSQRDDYRDKLHRDARVVFLGGSRRGSGLVRQLRTLPSLARLLRGRRFDLIVPVLEGPALVVALARPLAGVRTPVILSVQNAYLRAHRNAPSVKARAMRRLSMLAYGAADGAITLSHGVGADLATYVPSLVGRIRTVHNVGLARSPRAVHSSSKPDRGAVRVVACGRLIEVKDYPTLLDAIARLAVKIDVRLDIIGDGPLRGELEAYARCLGIAERTKFHGFVSDPDRIMAEADIFALTSTSEGFGNVIVEAMAVGLPVVATDCPHGPREILNDGEYGLLAPVGRSDAIAECIETLAADATLRERLAIGGRKRAADFTPAVIGRELANALTELSGLVGKASR